MMQTRNERFHKAIQEGDMAAFTRLIGEGVDVSSGGGEFNQPPIMSACWGDHLEMVRSLVDHGADINYNGFDEGRPLTFAAATGNIALLEHLLALGAAVDAQSPLGGETALHKAVFRNRHEAVRMLIEHGAAVNLPTRSGGHTAMFEGGAKLRGERPLHLAAAYSDPAMVQLLLDAGADKTLTDDRDESPIAWAGRHQRTNEIFDVL
jgi:ankyrin repeat protein